MKNMHWILCLLSLAAVAVSVIVLVKVGQKCQKDSYMSPMGRVRADNDDIIGDLAESHCSPDQIGMALANYKTLRETEDACEPEVSLLWDDTQANALNLGTADDMIMSYLCNETIKVGKNQQKMKPFARKHFPWQANFIDCALKNSGNASKCCDTNQEPVWNN